ncbi:MAG TPA: CopD family protein [Tepidisphaeraceae bacterium]|jgi:putative copper export protein|nr:CopD family protein [Tepidisphaeraceae bacterium]
MNPITDTALLAITRAVHFGACLLLAGVFIFDRCIVGRDEGGRKIVASMWTPIARALVLLALPAALLSGVGWLILVAMDMNDVPFAQAIHPDVLKLVLQQSQFGLLWQFRAMAWLATCIAAVAAIAMKRGTFFQGLYSWAAVLAGAVLSASIARAGHGGEGTRLHQAADMTHLLVGSAWPIGLLPLGLLLWRFHKSPVLSNWTALVPLVRRFSVMSCACVLLLAASGIVNAWPLVGRLSNLVNTAYGRTLTVKVSLFALMVILGAINLLYLSPRLSPDYRSSSESTRQAAFKRLRKNVWLEIILGTGVLLAAGLLGTLMPACDCACVAAH